MRKTFGVWKTTVLGGVFFLLPFAIVVFLVGQLAEIIWSVAQPLKPYLPALSFGRVSVATVAATLLLVVLCYLAGLAARRSFASRFTGKIEKNLLVLFPRYAVLKDQFAANFGGQPASAMKPVLVQLDDAVRLGFEVDRAPAGLVSVYLPGSPDPWQGVVVHVEPARVQALAVDFAAAVAMCESMGRTSGRVLQELARPGEAGAAASG
jgi:uncharacterized membrane protein